MCSWNIRSICWFDVANKTSDRFHFLSQSKVWSYRTELNFGNPTSDGDWTSKSWPDTKATQLGLICTKYEPSAPTTSASLSAAQSTWTLLSVSALTSASRSWPPWWPSFSVAEMCLSLSARPQESKPHGIPRPGAGILQGAGASAG